MAMSLGGFSGINTDQMIQQLMYIESAPIRRMEEEQSLLNNKIETWQKINSSVDTLKTKATDIQDVFGEMTTSTSDESIVTATVESDASSGTYDVTVDKLAKRHRIASTQQADSTTDLNLNGGAGGSFNITVAQGEPSEATATISVSGDATLNNVASAINDQGIDADGNQIVQASVVDNTLVIESAETGNINSLSIDDTDGMLQELGVVDGSNNIQNTLQGAQDAQFDVNGITDITRSSNTDIDDVVNGVSFNLKETGTATIEVEQDNEAIKEKIQAFVDQYNAVQSKINKYGDKEAILQGDAALTSLQSKLYESVVAPVDDTSLDKNTLSLIGISVGDNGKLSIDESELEDNLNNNLEQVKGIFNSETDGIIKRVEQQVDLATDMFDGYLSGKIDSLENQVDYIDDDISNMERRLELKEERLQQQFTRMETAISEMKNQQSWLSSQVGSLGL